VTGPRRNYASDNVAAAHPAILAALAAANAGTATPYGADALSARLTAAASAIFEREVAILPVATGTAANALALSLYTPPFGAVCCHAQAHIEVDECGAPEFYTGGAKLVALPARDGKLGPAQLAAAVEHARAMGVHHVQPAMVSVTQASEWGTVYSLTELDELAEAKRRYGLRMHMDGARFANALVHLGCTPAEASWRRGVDVLALGATKNGALAAEAIVLFDTADEPALALRRKRAGHLWSKGRYLAAQLLAYLEDDLWLDNARHANEMAARLAAGLQTIAGVRLVQRVEANELFLTMPPELAARLRAAGFEFEAWSPPAGTTEPTWRLVTSWDVAPAEVDDFLATARAAAKPPA
jgi:threonine aldolase